MTTIPSALHSLLALAVAATLGVAACSSSSAPSARPMDRSTTPPVSGEPLAGSLDPGSGATGGSAGDPGSGVGIVPVNPPPVDPGAGRPQLVRPVPGRLNPHPVVPTALQASVDGRHVLVEVSWYGGVEPCSVLDSVLVERNGGDIAITPIEGSSDATAICIEIALLKATIVDLGELEPGTWRIVAPGSGAAPVVIAID